MKKIVLLVSFIFVALLSKATHNRAGEILYKRIAPFSQMTGGINTDVYTYSITVIKYMDDGQGIADRCVDTVYFGDGTRGVAPRANGTGTLCFCGPNIGCGSLIVNTASYKVKYCVYSITHTYSGPGSYIIKSIDFNRNQGIHNIPNSVGVAFYLESYLMVSSSIGTNTSPVLINPPIDQATVGTCFYHNVGAVDADADSLSYEISTCRDETGQTAPGYFDPESSYSFTINHVTGLLSWCTPQYLAEYNMAIIVKEWRKNTSGAPQLIGSVLRDMQVLVKYGPVGIKENSLSQQVQVFPNPFNEKLEIDLGATTFKEVEVCLYANDGKLVSKSLKNNVSGNFSLSLNSVVPGIYSLSVKTETGVFYKKIVKN